MHLFSVEPQYGRRQVLYKMWDAETYPFMKTTKSTFLTYMTLAREPKTQGPNSFHFSWKTNINLHNYFRQPVNTQVRFQFVTRMSD